MPPPIRISVTGAAGRISYALLCRIAAGAMFGPDQPVALSLLDVPKMMPLVDAVMMELDDCAFPLLSSIRASTDAAEAFSDADWILLLGSAAFHEGMTRADALLANGPIFQAQGRGDQRVGQDLTNPRRGEPLQYQLFARTIHGA